MFIRFDTTHERDRQTDTQTDTAWRHRPRLCIASSGKNEKSMPNASLLILNSPERLKRSMTELRPALERRLIGCCLTPYARSLNINSFRIYYRQACAAATDSMLRCLSIPGYQLVCVFSESGLNDCVQHEIDEYYSSFMSCVMNACYVCLPVRQINPVHDYVIPGWNDIVSDKHNLARDSYLAWSVIGKNRGMALNTG